MKDSVMEPIAIVGIGAVMPGASDKDIFWKNILDCKSAIREVPADYWDWKLYYDPDPKALDKTYSKIGGFIGNFKFDSIKHRIPPQVALQMDATQHLAVETASMALEDAGYKTKPFDRTRCAVIIGNAMGGMKKEKTDARILRQEYYRLLKETKAYAAMSKEAAAAFMAELEAKIVASSSPITEDTMPGELSNVIAGRVANVLNVNGTNFTVDAACATSIAAIAQAMNGLRLGNFDMAVCGGVDKMMSAAAYVKFCKIGALSPDGSYVFDARANGFVMAEGAGMFILKRLSDAVKDGDKIYALVRAIGASSDGRGKGITAPNPKGQKLAVEHAFSQLDYTPADVSFIEAHGTATRVGDITEFGALNEVFAPFAAAGSIGISSVKSNMGHAKAAAGIASAIKAAMALHAKVLPPSINFQTPNPNINWSGSPFRVITSAEEWKSSKLRRANVSSFGFGGTNFHMALEEYNPSLTRLPEPKAMKEQTGLHHNAAAPLRVAIEKLAGESVTFSAETKNELFEKLRAFARELKDDASAPAILATYALNCRARSGFGVSLSGENPAKFREKIEIFIKMASAQDVWAAQPLQLKMKGIYPYIVKDNRSKVALMFPGQGSQYVDMMKDLASKYQVVQDTFDEGDRILYGMINTTITDVIWSKPGETPEQLAKREDAIKQTQMTQPAVLTADIAMLRLLKSFGIKPDMVFGHSLGEYAAAVASGVFTFQGGLKAVTTRAKEMASIDVADPGKMASVAAHFSKVDPELKKISGYVACANKNCPTQTVIAGDKKAIADAIAMFTAMGIQAAEIPVSHAFHSEIIRPAAGPYKEFLKTIPVSAPQIPLLSNVTADFYPNDPDTIRNMMVEQVCHSVEWIRQLEKAYSLGVRVFIECGPKRVLSAFATSTLQDKKDTFILSSNHPKRGGIIEFNDLMSNLMCAGVPVNWTDKHPLKSSGIYTPAFTAEAAKHAGVQSDVSSTASVSAPVTADANAYGFNTNPICVSGIAAGTPGSWDKVFREGNLDEILRGQNMIEPISAEQQQKQIDKHVTFVIKSSTGESRMEKLTSIAQAIKLVGKAGQFDVVKEFGLPENWVRSMDRTFHLAIAAGMLALKDAGIPLVLHYKKTSTGSYLPDRWALPPSMSDDTGVIFGSAFPTMNNIVDEVSRCLKSLYSTKTTEEMYALYDRMIQKITDPEDRRELTMWFTENFNKFHSGTAANPYAFSQAFLLKIIPIGHSQFCQWIKARGPATHISAACSTTTQAVGIAEDWIRTGRAKRVIVIAADDIASEITQEWVLAGFLASGAASTSASVSEAAIPFDRRRNGLIVGMGAVSLVIEDETEVRKRGMKPLARVLGTTITNSAFHPTRLDINHVADTMDRLMKKVEKIHGLDRHQMAANTLFMSHETYTPARGGSASAEVYALRKTFGDDAMKVIVSNVKGFTGHTMGASLEDAVAVRALNTGMVPPIANYKVPDPELAGINLSKGGKYDFKYCLRLAAGFGSQLAMSVIEKTYSAGEPRIENEALHTQWLKEVSGQNSPVLEVVKNTLRVKDTDEVRKGGVPPIAMAATQSFVKSAPTAAAPAVKAASAPRPAAPAPVAAAPVAAPAPAARPAAASPAVKLDEESVKAVILKLITEKTGYPQDMLELDLDMEADLGIDTVKQAELFAAMREHYKIPQRDGVKLKDYPTIRHCIKFVMTEGGGASAPVAAAAPAAVAPAPAAAPAPVAAPVAVPVAAPVVAAVPVVQTHNANLNEDEVKGVILKLITEKTGYPQDMLELDLDMEADLGIDTVKQAELFAAMREHYKIPQRDGIKLKDYPTIRHCIKFVMTEAGGSHAPVAAAAPAAVTAVPVAAPAQVVAAPVAPVTAPVPVAAPVVAAVPVAQTHNANLNEDEVKGVILKLITEKTGYPQDMLELDLDMEADLGIDTVKQAELFAAMREHYKIPQRDGIKLKDYPTIRHCINFVMTEGGGASAPVAAAAPAAVAPAPVTAPAAPVAVPVAPAPVVAAPVAPTPAPAAATPAAAPAMDSEVQETIVNMIAEKTGYPKDMLELDLDMEADLGIDTVKQAELFAAMREYYKIPQKEGIKLKDYPTIRHCINFVLTERNGGTSAPVAASPSAAAAQAVAAAPVQTAAVAAAAPAAPAQETAPVQEAAKPVEVEHTEPRNLRHLLFIEEAAPLSEENRKLSTLRPVLIFSDNATLIRHFQAELTAKKVPVHIFTSLKGRTKNSTIVNWDRLDEVETALRAYQAEGHRPQGIIYLLGCVAKRLNTKVSPHHDLTHYAMPLFMACKVFEKDFADHSDADTFMSVDIQLDGAFGYKSKKDFDPIYGAIIGETLCFRKDMHELCKMHSKMLDFDSSHNAQDIVRLTMHEILHGDSLLLVGYRADKRVTYRARAERIDKSKLRYGLDGKRFIITGGGRGLGSMFARAVAKRFKVKIIVLDIVHLQEDTPKWAAMSKEELAQLKTDMWHKMKADTSHKVTPVMLEKEFRKVVDSVTLYNNLQALRELGAETEYHVCDVTNDQMMADTVKEIKAKHGKIDGVVHFAGMEHSKLVNEKTAEEFFRVFDVKAHSAMTLVGSNLVREGGFWVFISSIAGKFGNLGQSDYAAASDYISKLANSLSTKGVRAIATDMSAYASVGMAVRPGVEAFLTSQGMDFVYPEEGMNTIIDELVYGEVPEIVLSSYLGNLDWDNQLFIEHYPKAKAALAPEEDGGKKTGGETGGHNGGGVTPNVDTPMLDEITAQDDKSISAKKLFDEEADTYLKDHSIAGTPYVPGVMGVETFVETGEKLLGEMLAGLEDVQFALPIKLLRGKPQQVRVSGTKDSHGRVSMKIESDFINPHGVKMGNPRTHFTAHKLEEFESAWRNVSTPEITPDMKPVAVKEEIYKQYFHGPSFQVLDSVLSVEPDQIFAVYKKPAAPLWGDGVSRKLSAYPMIIEALFQTCGYRDLHYDKKTALPDSIDKLLIAGEGEAPEKLYLLAVFKGKTLDSKSIYDAYAYDEGGRLWIELQNFYLIPQ